MSAISPAFPTLAHTFAAALTLFLAAHTWVRAIDDVTSTKGEFSSIMSTCPATIVARVATVPRRVSIEFVADVVCPWCYIGLARLQEAGRRAAEQHGIMLDITFTPFILRRHMPKAGVDKLAMFASGGMGEASARAKFDHIRDAALADGLCLDFSGQRAGNSEDAHRLLLWAARMQGGGAWLALLTSMFEKYNCERGWLGDHGVLLGAVERTSAAADRAGADGTPVQSPPLERAEAAAVLADESAYLDELERGLARSARLGAHGVPLFVIDAASALPGAVPAADLLRAVVAAADAPLRRAEWYVARANAHDVAGLAEMLRDNVDMFGGPCDHVGLDAFFASYPGIHWDVTTEYTALPHDDATIVFGYRRSWEGADGKRLVVDAEESITFDREGKISKIAYTRAPSEAREIVG